MSHKSVYIFHIPVEVWVCVQFTSEKSQKLFLPLKFELQKTQHQRIRCVSQILIFLKKIIFLFRKSCKFWSIIERFKILRRPHIFRKESFNQTLLVLCCSDVVVKTHRKFWLESTYLQENRQFRIILTEICKFPKSCIERTCKFENDFGENNTNCRIPVSMHFQVKLFCVS